MNTTTKFKNLRAICEDAANEARDHNMKVGVMTAIFSRMKRLFRRNTLDRIVMPDNWEPEKRYRDIDMYTGLRVVLISQSGRWVRDLTEEGIEPNPGPIIDTNYMVRECEEQVIREFTLPLLVQSSNIDFRGYLDNILGVEDLEHREASEYFTDLLEDLVLLVADLSNSISIGSSLRAITHFIKHRIKGSISNSIYDTIQELFGQFYAQAEDEGFNQDFERLDSANTFLRNLLSKFNIIKGCAAYRKLYDLFHYLVSLSIFEKFGITFDTLRYGLVKQEALKRKYHMGVDFFICLIDTITFICERGIQCMKTGTMDPIFHSSSKYDEWFVQCKLLKDRSQYISNPEPHGFTFYEYFADLDDAIEKGECIVRNAKAYKQPETKMIESFVADLKFIKGTEMSRRSASQSRKAPLALLIFGGSNVAKSTFTQLLFVHFGRILNLPTDDEYKFTRYSVDKHWNNFHSSAYCVVMDDVAFMHPNSASGGDPTIMEVIQVNNNVSFCPPQAAIDDKGKTPCKPKLLLATTNTENLNAHAYFSCPLALQRRFPFVIDLQPKEKYTKFGVMIDSALLPDIAEGEYPDFWNITIKQVVPMSTRNREHQRGKLEIIETFDNIYEFVDWYTQLIKDYEEIQSKASKCVDNLKKVVLCDNCLRPLKGCKCEIEETKEELEFLPQAEDGDSDDSIPPLEQVLNRIDEAQRLEDERLEEEARQRDFENSFNEFGDFEQDRYNLTRGRYIPYNRLFNEPEEESSIPYVFNEERARRLFYQALGNHQLVYAQAEERASWIRAKCYCILAKILCWYYKYPCVYLIITFLNLRGLLFWFVTGALYDVEVSRMMVRALGRRVQRSIYDNRWLLMAIPPLLIIYKMYVAHKRFSAQGDSISGDDMDEKEKRPPQDPVQRPDVWKKEEYATTQFDITPQISSSLSLSDEQFANMLKNNCVCLRLRHFDNTSRVARAFCLGGQQYISNNHLFNRDDIKEIEIIHEPNTAGVNRNMRLKFSANLLFRDIESDVIIITIPCLPPRRNLYKYFAKTDFRYRGPATYMSREKNGEIETMAVSNVSMVQYEQEEMKSTPLKWKGTTEENTRNGYCGSILYARTPSGFVILGIHIYGGRLNTVMAIPITYEYASQFFKNSVLNVQSSTPQLSSDNHHVHLTDLHEKASIRFIEKGTANVYGSFVGFRRKMKSRVQPTLIRESMLKRGYMVSEGAPLMRSWMPWNIALNDMTRPVLTLDLDILEKAKQSFCKDILNDLTDDDLKIVMVYDTFTAINGAAGVLHVDKIVTHTSAGNPYKKSKKFFLEPLPAQEGLMHPVTFTDEIMDRVKCFEEKYKNGERVYPNFCAHLKDEPVSFTKIEKGKTRVFTGAPIDWSIVVRKYLLSVIKLIQSKRYLFESAPGTIAQSREWDQIYHYLVQFGEERMVAGDYGKFDKTMPPTVILAAYDIMKVICKAAGYTDDQLRVISCIAYDTAFPLVDFNGDLIEFIGSNPSGHPLTVIVNGLANALYMRYAYYILNPDQECDSFKDNVALMTYGDDNVMGISKDVSFFHHTSIRDVLADVGITYTMADKEAESIPYINIKDVSFLKRSWRYEEDLACFVCPIDHASINKMLTTCVASKSVSPEAQAISVIGTAIREYFWYGKEIFEEKSKMFREVISENKLDLYLEDWVLPTWDQLIDDFNHYDRYVVEREGQ